MLGPLLRRTPPVLRACPQPGPAVPGLFDLRRLGIQVSASAFLLSGALHAGAASAQATLSAPPARPGAATHRESGLESGPANAAQAADPVRFAADSVSYAADSDIVTAQGSVVLDRAGQSLRADRMQWNRKTGQIVATGQIRLVDDAGNVVYTDQLALTDELRAGAIGDMLLVLREGGRLAARGAERDRAGNLDLRNATFSGCAVEDEDGCPRRPSWEITAVKVHYDVATRRVSYVGARLNVFGFALLPLPGLSHGVDGGAKTGWLVPEFSSTPANGFALADSYYWRLADNRDLTVAAHAYSAALPLLSATYRQLNAQGAFQVTGYLTRSSKIDVNANGGDAPNAVRQWRGYVEASTHYQFDPYWGLEGFGRYVSDRTFLQRYEIGFEDRLRSSLSLRRIDGDSFFELSGWAVQTLRVGDTQGQMPLALPTLDWRQRFEPAPGAGHIELEVNTVALSRTAGQDTERGFARAQWDWRTLTGMGQLVQVTGLVRGDLYHSSSNALTTPAIYRGLPGWQGRGLATAALDVKWPLVGAVWGGTQVITPRFQIAATPHVRNLALPDEDSRSVELEDDNLFALNRFPGYDRVEDGLRFTYGADWEFAAPGWRVIANIGQSYRLSNQTSLLPVGTGLARRLSDYVGRAELRWGAIVAFTYRFRLDETSLALRRSEFDATLGDHATYAQVGYSRLHRDITAAFPDLTDRQELRVAGRVVLARNVSAFGSALVNMTSLADDPVNGTARGFQLLRHRLGVTYNDNCLEFGLTWRRDYVTTGDAKAGNSFLFSISLHNLGGR